jgi:CHAT domain-containing protein/tetratricopeptide (TPR) repeat protein
MKYALLFIAVFITALASAQNFERIDSLLVDARYQEAVDAANKALQSNLLDKSLLLNRKAEGLIQMGDFKQAREILDLAIITNTSARQQAITNTNYGLLHLNLGRNDLALEHLLKALQIFENEQTLDRAKALSYIGQVYNVLGKTSQAQENLMMSLSIRQKLLPEKHELMAAAYNDLGLSYVQSDKDKALDYYEKALSIYKSLHGNDHPKIAIANVNSGFVYRELELYGDAVNNFETALNIWNKLFPAPHPSKAFALLNLGQTYLKMGDQKAARAFLDQSLKMYRDVHGLKHPDIANVLNLIGNMEISNEKFNTGLQCYQEALHANVKTFENNSVEINPKPDNYYNGKVLLYTLHFKAQALEKKYFGQSLKLSELQLALHTLHTCDTLIDQLRQQTSNEGDKLSLGVIANEVYADGVRVAFEIAENSVLKKELKEKAFYFSEKSKSAVLLEAISDSQAKSFAGIPAELISQEKEIKAQMAIVAQKLSQKPSVEEEKTLRETSFNLNRDYTSFIATLEKDYPQYFNLKFNSTTPSVREIQKVIDSKTAVISYFIDENNSRIYIFNVSKNNFTIVDRPLPSNFDKYITGFRNSIYFNDIHTFLKAGNVLSEILVPKFTSAIANVIFIPTGRLGIIPFETLLSKETSTPDYAKLPYLIKQLAIRYEFSASLLLQKVGTRTLEKPSILLCAPVTFPEITQLPALPGTESEVNAISAMFAAKNFSASANVGTTANEDVVKNNSVKDFSILHFATHGIVDEINPELSKIFLQAGTSGEDGSLYSGEIYNLQLQANLVTLSACQTGLGKISKGEGVIGLSRALVYAGAKNVIVSFWSVADESTAGLMTDFYSDLLGSSETSKPEFQKSLRNAKLKMIGSGKYIAPYYWAPFILIGF